VHQCKGERWQPRCVATVISVHRHCSLLKFSTKPYFKVQRHPDILIVTIADRLEHVSNIDLLWQNRHAATMSEGRHNFRKSSRPPRIRVPNNEPAVFTVDTRKVLGVIKRISATGGSVVISAKGPAPHGTVAEMCQHYLCESDGTNRVSAHRGRWYPTCQAFRFLAMDAVSRKRFTAAAQQMQHAGFSDAEERQTALDWASKSLSKVTQRVGRLIGMSNKKR
jgi:hypothetical protein